MTTDEAVAMAFWVLVYASDWWEEEYETRTEYVPGLDGSRLSNATASEIVVNELKHSRTSKPKNYMGSQEGKSSSVQREAT